MNRRADTGRGRIGAVRDDLVVLSDESRTRPLERPRQHPDRQAGNAHGGGGGGRPVLIGCLLAVLVGILGAIGIETASALALVLAAVIFVFALFVIAE